uniref:DUF4939 domain-containing protein n=1 Tax=Xenopus tropicalis TaxID=8364 RepID=A0A803K0P2_XENTR
MEPSQAAASATLMESILEAFVKRLEHQETQQMHLSQTLQHITTRLDALQVPQQMPQMFPDLPPSPPPASSTSPHLSEPYGGDPETCRGTLNQCKIHFELFPHRYPNEKSKVAFIIALLFGKALAWASPLWERDEPLVNDATAFLSTFQQIFERITQGSRAASDYAIDFRTLAAETSWNNEALIAAFWMEG